MTKEFTLGVLSTNEVRTYYVDFTADLPSGVTVSSGAATHIPPSGAATTPTVGAVLPGDILPVTVGPLSVVGNHIVTLVATLSDGQKSIARLIIPVGFPAPVARATMYELIAELRAMTDTSPNDYSVAGVPYWTDAQLQIVLDRHRDEIYGEELSFVPITVAGGSIEYHDYYSAYDSLEQTDGGTAVFILREGTGGTVGTALWSADYLNGKVTFPTTTGGTAYYLTGRSYDLNQAASEVWGKKAAHLASTAMDWKTDNMQMTRSQLLANAREMALYYQQIGGPTTATMYRGDM